MSHSSPTLTMIGDVCVDVVLGPIEKWPAVGTEVLMERSELRPGGSAANAALAATYLGAPCKLLSLVGSDTLGQWLIEQLAALDAPLESCEAATSITVGVIHACAERTFLTTRGHLDALTLEHIRPFLTPAPARGSIALLSGVFLTPALRVDYLPLIDALAALGYEVALDTGWPPENWNEALRKEALGWLARCDHVLLNEVEVASLAGRGDVHAALDELSRHMKPGASLIVKTGARGALGLQRGKPARADAIAATVFDTIGAGDAFNAGYLLARLSGSALGAALEAGCRAAAAIITRFPRHSIKPGELAALAQPVPVLEPQGLTG